MNNPVIQFVDDGNTFEAFVKNEGDRVYVELCWVDCGSTGVYLDASQCLELAGALLRTLASNKDRLLKEVEE